MFLYFYNCSGISYSVVIFRVKMQTKKKQEPDSETKTSESHWARIILQRATILQQRNYGYNSCAPQLHFSRFMWHQSEFGWVPNRQGKCNLNPNLVWFDQIQKRFIYHATAAAVAAPKFLNRQRSCTMYPVRLVRHIVDIQSRFRTP